MTNYNKEEDMTNNIKIAPSIIAADFSCLRKEVKKAEDSGADLIHIDVMDGHFVPNITIGSMIVEAIRPHTKLLIDSHLMIENPSFYIKDFLNAGSDIITVHAECYGRLRPASKGRFDFPKEVDRIDSRLLIKDIRKIKSSGAKAAVAINPGTPLCIKEALKDLDMVLIMSVNPGFYGQAFMPKILPKIRDLRKIFNKDIEVDGGINDKNAKDVIDAGANILVTGSYFFKSKNPKEAIKRLKFLTWR